LLSIENIKLMIILLRVKQCKLQSKANTYQFILASFINIISIQIFNSIPVKNDPKLRESVKIIQIYDKFLLSANLMTYIQDVIDRSALLSVQVYYCLKWAAKQIQKMIKYNLINRLSNNLCVLINFHSIYNRCPPDWPKNKRSKTKSPTNKCSKNKRPTNKSTNLCLSYYWAAVNLSNA